MVHVFTNRYVLFSFTKSILSNSPEIFHSAVTSCFSKDSHGFVQNDGIVL